MKILSILILSLTFVASSSFARETKSQGTSTFKKTTTRAENKDEADSVDYTVEVGGDVAKSLYKRLDKKEVQEDDVSILHTGDGAEWSCEKSAATYRCWMTPNGLTEPEAPSAPSQN